MNRERCRYTYSVLGFVDLILSEPKKWEEVGEWDGVHVRR